LLKNTLERLKGAVQWDTVLNSLIGSSPATALCALAARALWTRLRERDAEITLLNQARIDDFKAILKLLDSSPRSKPGAE
jgi:hypothetical protein